MRSALEVEAGLMAFYCVFVGIYDKESSCAPSDERTRRGLQFPHESFGLLLRATLVSVDPLGDSSAASTAE